MKKILLSLTPILLFVFGVNAQIISDNFDSYTDAMYMADQSGGTWTTWSDTPGTGEDAYVSTAFAASGANSIVLEDASTDLVLPFGNLTTGSYEFGAKMYFPAGNGGYFNLMHEFDAVAEIYEWSIDIYFNGDGTGSTTAAGVADVMFAYSENMWIDVKCIVDLDNDLAQMWVEGMIVRQWQWSLVNNTGDPGLNQLAVADFYPAAVGTPLSYMDDVYFQEAAPLCDFVTNLICDNFDNYTAGEYVGSQSGGIFTTWGDAPGTTEDAFVSDTQSSSGNNSVELITGLGTDFVLPLGNLTSGEYTIGMKIYVPAAASGYFNVMHEFDGNTPTYQWALDVFFNVDGSGSINAGGDNAASFSYTQDSWVDAVVYVDMDLDRARLFIENKLVYDWQFSLQGGGDPGTNALAAVNMYPGVEDTDHFFVDDVYVRVSDVVNADTDCFNSTAIICDHFENYTTGEYVGGQSGGVWSTWGDAPASAEDAFVSENEAFEGTHSIELVTGLGTDLVLPFGDLTEGEYMLGMKMYVPAAASGYFNVMHSLGDVNEWGLDVFFNADGSGEINAAGNASATFSYSQDSWVDVMLNVDLDWSWAILTIDGTEVHAWDWSMTAAGDAGLNVLGVMDIYPGVEATDHFYVDNVYFETADNIDFTSIQEFESFTFNAFPNPNTGDFTIVNKGAAGEYVVQLIDVLGRVVYTNTINTIEGNEIKVNSGITNAGVYSLTLMNTTNNESQSVQLVIE